MASDQSRKSAERKQTVFCFLTVSLILHAAVLVLPADTGRRQERISRIEVGLVSLPPRMDGGKSAPEGRRRNIAAPSLRSEMASGLPSVLPAGKKEGVSPPAATSVEKRRVDPDRLESAAGTFANQKPSPIREPPSAEEQPAAEFSVPAQTNPGPLSVSEDAGSFPERKSAVFLQKGRAKAAVPLIEATPRYDHNAPPPYPRLARLRGWEGEVLLRVLVSEAGDVRRISVERSSSHAVLDAAALKAVRRWRFHPSRLGAARVEGEVLVPLRFKLRDTP